jgi:hypothetical protein
MIDNSYVDQYQPPTSVAGATDPNNSPVAAPMEPTAPVAAAANSSSPISQALEDQNIFVLLGVEGTDEEKNTFLDELQKVIWEDFLENDVELLVTEDELSELRRIQSQKIVSEEQLQEDIVVYLEKLIPDLEEIMLEKALELKEDMVRERLAGMRDYYASNTAALAKLDEAEQLMDDDQWRAAAETLNTSFPM